MARVDAARLEEREREDRDEREAERRAQDRAARRRTAERPGSEVGIGRGAKRELHPTSSGASTSAVTARARARPAAQASARASRASLLVAGCVELERERLERLAPLLLVTGPHRPLDDAQGALERRQLRLGVRAAGRRRRSSRATRVAGKASTSAAAPAKRNGCEQRRRQPVPGSSTGATVD